MRLSISPQDKTIALDGIPLAFDFPVNPGHADAEYLQWHGEALHGTIQRHGSNEIFSDPAVVGDYLAAYLAEAIRRGQEVLKAEQESASRRLFEQANEMRAYASYKAHLAAHPPRLV